MAKTLEQLRTELAESVGRLFSGTATGGSTTTLVDTAGLERFTETDALKGALLYISDTTDDLAPEGESRRIQSFNFTSNTITVDRAFSAAVGSGDTYEVYLAPLDLAQWDQCLNDAIRGAWPEVFTPAVENLVSSGALTYALSANADRVLGAEITFPLTGYPFVLEFDGSSGQVNCGSGTSLDDLPTLGNFTVEAWVNPDTWGQTNAGRIMYKTGWQLWFNGSGTCIRARAEYDTTAAVTDSAALTLGTWRHIAAAWDLATKSWKDIAIDGVWSSATPTAGVGSYVTDAAADFKLGQGGGATTLDGKLGWVRLSSGHRYTIGTNFTPPARNYFPDNDENTIGLWIREGAGSTVYDCSDNSNNGTITGAVWRDNDLNSVLASYPSQPLLGWYAVGNPGALTLKLSRPVPKNTDMGIRVLTGQKFDELTTGQSTNLDLAYALMAARVSFYQRMADASRQSDRSGFLQLMAHWQEKAAERKAELAAALMGYQQAPRREKK